jgi:hypothetical protein
MPPTTLTIFIEPKLKIRYHCKPGKVWKKPDQQSPFSEIMQSDEGDIALF